MEYIFEHVDKSKITTGLLVDYGLQIIAPEYFDGVPATKIHFARHCEERSDETIYKYKMINNE
jgi:hypothetical protein